MKILFASHSSGLAGAEQSLLHLVQEAARRGHTGVVVLPERGPLRGQVEELPGSFEVVILRNRLWMGRRFSRLVGTVRALQATLDIPGYVAHIRAGNYDAVVVNSSVSPVPLVAARIAGIPALQMVRESLISNPMLRSALPKALIKRLIFSWSSFVICISKYVAAQYDYPSRVIYPQVSERFLDFQSPASTTPIMPQRAVICGTISPEKGQLDAIRAIKVARDQGAEISLDIYGQGKAADIYEVELLIRELQLSNWIKFKGPASDMISVYLSADLALVCSRNEGFGKTTAEAILLSRPVIAYGLGGTLEILEYGGGISTSSSPEEMGLALYEVATQPQLFEKLRKEARDSKLRFKLLSSARLVIDCVEDMAGG
ncbi:glycosyltransferase family 4 protein [Arthrobacter sp. B1I2]|uniref:glycosyltransferase family 4 protein n=1 Tax=Arthrobacter sp. B1I2 TaxID=3042263 RepID=UPI002788D7D0|nr:glycosyltransferase family 4 protein [Arthrobacter sp. B1I2]MDQ0731124.1 glycosyltransferase involved in cell wall biosynthesis [Arthrobacter sp. B1I2]